MARKQKGQKTPNFSLHAKTPNGSSKGKKLESYEDTLEPGSTDEHIFRRDQILFNPQDESDDDENMNMGPDGEEVLSLNLPRRRDQTRDDDDNDEAFDDEEFDDDDDEEEEEEEMPAVTKASKKKAELATKGRFGKPVVSSDEEGEDEEDASGSGSDEDEDEEGWGRSYYSRPSTRKEKEELRGEYDEKKEEDRELELKEVKRLQRKSREKLANEDWGLVDLDQEAGDEQDAASGTLPSSIHDKAAARPAVAVPQTSDPATLVRHLEAHEPVKIALARDLSLAVRKIGKTARGIKKMMNEEEGHENLHKGLGWLHYQTLLTYTTTLAFYLHLAALPAATRPDLANHPILARLLELKKGVSSLEELDFAAGSVSDIDPLADKRMNLEDQLELGDDGELNLDTEEKKLAFMELLAKMREADGSGVEVMSDEDENEDDDEDMDDEDLGDFDDSWKAAGLDEDELADLMMDAEGSEGEDSDSDIVKEVPAAKTKKSKSKTTSSAAAAADMPVKAKKRSKAPKDQDQPTPIATFAPLAEPAFYSSSSSSSSKPKTKSRAVSADDDTLGDATSLLDADASDKERRTKSLRFHTSKIASQSARRAAARAQRMGGDEDVPYRDRQKARDAALRKNSAAAAAQDAGEDLDGGEWTEADKKRAREVRDEEPDADADAGDAGEADEYYDLVKRRKVQKQEEKEAAHEERRADKFASFEDDTADGPRALTRAIEKNRGLTPRRNKTGRNPRVKKRQAYEKAKQKVGSQRAVFKGGQAAVGGKYQGEKTGISTVVKSRKF